MTGTVTLLVVTTITRPPLTLDVMTQSQRERRARLLDTVIEMVARTDPRLIQMKDVSAHSDIALATLYRYCSSREHLFAMALGAWQRRLTERVRSDTLGAASKTATTPEPGSAADRVVAHMHRELRAFQRHPNFAILLRIVQSSSNSFANEEIAAVGTDHGETLEALMRGFPPETVVPAMFGIGSVFNICLIHWSAGRMLIDTAYTMVEDVVRLLLRDA